MSKAALTRQHLVKTSARLFNTQGYKSTSLGDIMEATGYTKGAIYAHFGSKSGLELASLEYMTQAFSDHMTHLIKGEKDAYGKLSIILDFFAGYAVNPPFVGGCPIVNASVELDDQESPLRQVVEKSMRTFYQALCHILDMGKKHGQIHPDTDTTGFASLLFSAVEGAVIIMRMTGERKHLRDVVKHLRVQVEQITRHR